MKIKPIDERLLHAISHVANYAKHNLEESDTEWEYDEGLQESLDLVQEYTSCFSWTVGVSQRGRIPHSWNQDTIFESESGYKMPITEEVSPEEKDANAKKLLEEIT